MEKYGYNDRVNGAYPVLGGGNPVGFGTPTGLTQKINEIYFSTIAREIYTFTPTQLQQIIDIANQCPLAGGTAVYKARGLWSTVNDSLFFDDTGVCNALGMSMRKAQTEAKLTKDKPMIYPNPANQTLNIYCPEIKDAGTQLIFYNLMGQKVHSSAIEKTHQQITLTGLRSGIYLVQIVSGQSILLTEKLIIE
ncbi:MAG: T9SS type A sorting domain-containing protein [Bacteroidia bacterium]|nr:T9SS type A sorting domain-containing protein [Bacteroidia bacterium]